MSIGIVDNVLRYPHRFSRHFVQDHFEKRGGAKRALPTRFYFSPGYTTLVTGTAGHLGLKFLQIFALHQGKILPGECLVV